MKIRTGFVSNSSSSSFCIYGTVFDESELREILGIDEENDENDYNDVIETIEKMFKDAGIDDIEIQSGPDGDYGIYIGKEWSEVADDQTGKQFKNDIEKKIKKVLNKNNIKFNTHAEAWRDG